MKMDRITEEALEAFRQSLCINERSSGTVEKYLRDVRNFADWLMGTQLTAEAAIGWKEYLLEKNYNPITINSMLSALNSFLSFIGMDFKIRFLKVQKRIFRDESRELTREEYTHLIETAKNLRKDRLALIIETIGATGIRVSEVSYITVEAARVGKVQINLKGKIRVIMLPNRLCRKLLKYAGKNKITSGEIFLTKGGRALSRKQIWAEMKSICEKAGISASKVFPHNLRHLFATVYYRVYKDIAKLADLLGHSSIETTRIYLLSTGKEHAREIEELGLVV